MGNYFDNHWNGCYCKKLLKDINNNDNCKHYTKFIWECR